MNNGCDYDPNKPIGSTKKMVESKPIMEQFNKYSSQVLKCSIDSGDDAVPEGARQFFKRHGYLIIENLYDPQKLKTDIPNLSGQINYYGSLNKFNHNPEESQVPGSLARYSYPPYKEIHSQIRLILEDILGEQLYNTYYYDRIYRKDQRLVRHKDRDACEISVSVQISSNTTQPWGFCLETLQGEERYINLKDGWGLLYMGCDVEHWREPLQSKYGKLHRILRKIIRKTDDTFHHQVFFHYVRANGSRVHFANDAAC